MRLCQKRSLAKRIEKVEDVDTIVDRTLSMAVTGEETKGVKIRTFEHSSTMQSHKSSPHRE